MAKSFAQYASQFLTQQHPGASSLSSSQPLFFSFTTDEGSRAGNDHGSDVDDLDDPHLQASRMSSRGGDSRGRGIDDMDDEDPYLRLDEEDARPGYASQSIPLIASSHYARSESPEYPKGWLAHQASPPRRIRSPSPSPSSSSSMDSSSSPPPFNQPIFHNSIRMQPSPTPQPPPPREPVSLSLTESLLPRDGTNRPLDVFSLPDPRHVPRGRRKLNDAHWTAVWCTGVSLCVFFSVLLLFTTTVRRVPGLSSPYTTLLHTVPMLTILTFSSALAAYAHVFLLRIFVRPVMVATSVFIPATLFVSAVWAFAGSFMWDGDQEPTWGETTGLRLFSLVPLVLSVLTARRLVDLPREIHSTSSILDLATRLLLANPFLLALSPAILLLALVASIPFLTLVFRLLLIGYTTRPAGGSLEYHVRGWADWAIVGAVAVWLWSWGVARGVLRTTGAGVIGAWYFADPDTPAPPPGDTHAIHAALLRAGHASLGSIALAALILTGIRLLALLALGLRLLPVYMPLALRPLAQPLLVGAAMAVGYLEGVTASLSRYALVYTGLTGAPFFPSARRARALTEAASAGRYRRKFKTEPPLTLLTYAPLTLTLPFALTTYLFVAHTLGAPDQALAAALLAGGVTALVGMFCVGLVKDTADALYVCYCIDKDGGARRRDEVFAAFEYEIQPRGAASRPQERGRQGQTQGQGQIQTQGRGQPQAQRKAPPPRTAPLSPSAPAHNTPPPAHNTPPPAHNTPPPSHPLQRPMQPSQHVQSAQPSQRQPPPPPETDIDPFEHEPLGDDGDGDDAGDGIGAPQEIRIATPYSVSPAGESDEEREGEGEESQIFPGSGLF
ncbi:plasma-membrane choline transporter-domain-containing protein [Hygrophoropsis aurantiaca]|uniref:Plasma-membrane choline transporter-domain-containing protein n=1 Tax=Hygrophoropsis aurantiaca TaxID=72124 RepID=A0ACB7ZYI8_9AGAM|nr:plasma-membrane choline transporter-domain-containing protein [Hygrophoropsis aurantiaca]